VARAAAWHCLRSVQLSKFKANIIFNVLGNAWVGLLTLAVTPFHVYFLGVEAYGFVGLITLLQVVLGALDLGISATLTKVVASDQSEGHRESANAVNTASSLYWAVAVIIAALLWAFSERLAAYWLARTSLEASTVTLGIQIVALYLGLRWPVALYTGILSGLQRMDMLNLIKTSVQTLRLVGGVAVLMLWPQLLAFLLWFAFSAAVELLAYSIATLRLLPTLRLRPSFSLNSLRDIWKYSATMNLIAITALVLSQADRAAVSQYLTLESLGYYSIAYSTSIAISLIQTAINSASFPAFSQSYSSGQHSELLERYQQVSQLMGFVVALPCFSLIFFGHEILQVWISVQVADQASTAMAWLAIGFFLNAVVSNAYLAAVACGQPGLPLKINLVAMVLYLPTLYALVHAFGIDGAAASYAALNVYYVLVMLPLVQVTIMKQTLIKWLRGRPFQFVLAGTGAFGLAKLVAVLVAPACQNLATLALGVGLYALSAWLLMPVQTQAQLRRLIGTLAMNRQRGP